MHRADMDEDITSSLITSHLEGRNLTETNSATIMPLQYIHLSNADSKYASESGESDDDEVFTRNGDTIPFLTILLGSGMSGQTWKTTDNRAAWISAGIGDNLKEFKLQEKTLNRLGHTAKSGYVHHEGFCRECIFYPLCKSSVIFARTPSAHVKSIINTWLMSFIQNKIGFLKIEPKHVMVTENDEIILTGLSAVFSLSNPPNPLDMDYGPYSPIGDNPLCFFSSNCVKDKRTLSFVMWHVSKICILQISLQDYPVDSMISPHASTRIQIRLSESSSFTDTVIGICQPPDEDWEHKLMADGISALLSKSQESRCRIFKLCC